MFLHCVSSWDAIPLLDLLRSRITASGSHPSLHRRCCRQSIARHFDCNEALCGLNVQTKLVVYGYEASTPPRRVPHARPGHLPLRTPASSSGWWMPRCGGLVLIGENLGFRQSVARRPFVPEIERYSRGPLSSSGTTHIRSVQWRRATRNTAPTGPARFRRQALPPLPMNR